LRFASLKSFVNHLFKICVIGSSVFVTHRIFSSLRKNGLRFQLSSMLSIVAVAGIFVGLMGYQRITFDMPPQLASGRLTLFITLPGFRWFLDPLTIPFLFGLFATIYATGCLIACILQTLVHKRNVARPLTSIAR
jgi:hypothetical protein